MDENINTHTPKAWRAGMLPFLIVFAFVFCASCAFRAGTDTEQRVTVHGQYDVAFGHVRR